MKTLSIELQIALQEFVVKVASVNSQATNVGGTVTALKLEAQALKRRCIAEYEQQS